VGASGLQEHVSLYLTRTESSKKPTALQLRALSMQKKTMDAHDSPAGSGGGSGGLPLGRRRRGYSEHICGALPPREAHGRQPNGMPNPRCSAGRQQRRRGRRTGVYSTASSLGLLSPEHHHPAAESGPHEGVVVGGAQELGLHSRSIQAFSVGGVSRTQTSACGATRPTLRMCHRCHPLGRIVISPASSDTAATALRDRITTLTRAPTMSTTTAAPSPLAAAPIIPVAVTTTTTAIQPTARSQASCAVAQSSACSPRRRRRFPSSST
jgi:hypothetical protein